MYTEFIHLLDIQKLLCLCGEKSLSLSDYICESITTAHVIVI